MSATAYDMSSYERSPFHLLIDPSDLECTHVRFLALFLFKAPCIYGKWWDKSDKTCPALCHKSSFNPCCNVHGFFFLKTSYVSLIYKCRIVLKIFTDPFLSYTPPQRGEISNFINRQTKSAWKYVIKLWILLSQPYTLPETNIYKAGMLLCTRRVCIL